MSVSITAMSRSPSTADVSALAGLLVDTVQSGSAVGFLDTLTVEAAERWWRDVLAGVPDRTIVLTARDPDGHVVGTVTLHRAAAPNQPTRGDVAKLLVHRGVRRRGVGRALMLAAEREAQRIGMTLLVLDTRRFSPAEHLYRAMGWTTAGVIPDFALDVDGRAFHDTVLFYKRLDPGEESGAGGSGSDIERR